MSQRSQKYKRKSDKFISQQSNVPAYMKFSKEVSSATGKSKSNFATSGIHHGRKGQVDWEVNNLLNSVAADDEKAQNPEVLSVDSDFGSLNGVMDSPEVESNVSSQDKEVAKKYNADVTTGKSTFYGRNTFGNISANYSYCTPPANSAISRCEKKEPERKKGSQLLSLYNEERGVDSAPVTAGHNQARKELHGQSAVNGDTDRPTRISSNTKPVVGNGREGLLGNVKGPAALRSGAIRGQIHVEDTDMKFTDLTHNRLKQSLDQIHGQASSRSLSAPLTLPLSLCNGVSHSRMNSARDFNGNGFLSSTSPTFNGCPSNQLCTAPSNEPSMQAGSKYDAVLHVKDDMLQEKESVILKLRLQVAALQHEVQESNASLRQLMQSRTTPPNKMFTATAMPESAGAQKKIHDLEQMLGKAESKMIDLSSQLERLKTEHDDEMKRIEMELKKKDELLADFKKKQKSSTERLEKYKKRVESLERYLGDLPTIEESNKLKTEADMLGIEQENMRMEIRTLKEKLSKKSKSLKEFEFELNEKKVTEMKQLNQIETLEEDLAKSEKSKQELGRNERDDLEELRFQVEHLLGEKEDATRLLSGNERRVKAQHEKQQENVSKLEIQLEEAKEVSENLRRELFLKNQAASKVQAAMMKFSSQNQQLAKEKISLLERIKSLEHVQVNLEEETKASLRLHRETDNAVHDLQAVAQVLMQTAQGSDPNISALLGVRSDPCVGDMDHHNDDRSRVGHLSVEETNKKLIEVRQLRRDIDQLRTMLSNKYAETIGDNCISQ
ncbi:unnamed protein product [Clavelina lepadiformis]|uniref:Uncharacterized protein n=2 Tax=Clavelina lepadiformis TaxID=159417 RepID=A0ABP0FN16_CLALP